MAWSAGKYVRAPTEQEEVQDPPECELDLVRELAEERAKSASLADALEQSRRENEELQAGRNGDNNRNTSNHGLDLFDQNRFSSTRHMASTSSLEESRFLSSMNQLSVASINVPECKATDGDEIHRHTYEIWKDLLVDSLKLAGIEDEATMFTVFKVKAGQRLLEIFRNTKSHAEAPDPDSAPFSNAMHRLKTYFGSGSDVMLMRRRLALMTQKPDESDLNFITRVGSTAHLCEFDQEKEFEEVVATVAEHARNRDVRTTALKMLSRKGSFTDLVDKVREIEAIRLNEEFVMQKHGKQTQALIAPVRSSPYWNPGHQQRTMQHYGSRGSMRPRGYPSRRGSWRAPRGRQSFIKGPQLSSEGGERCWRCYSVYHSANNCTVKDKMCNGCGRVGHIQRACPGTEPLKRPAQEYLEAPSAKIAVVEKTEVDKEEEEKEIHSVRAMLTAGTSNQPSTSKLNTVALVRRVKSNLSDATSSQVGITEFVDSTDESVNKNAVTESINTSSLTKSVVSISHVWSESSDEGIIYGVVAGLRCPFLIDSGAQVNTFTEDMFWKLMSDPKYKSGVFDVRDQTDRPLKAYGSVGDIKVSATFHAYLYVSDNRPTFLEKFYVVNEARALLGRTTAARYSVLMIGLKVPVEPRNVDAMDSLYAGEIAAISPDEFFPKFNIPPVKIHYDKSKPPCRNIFLNIPLAVKPLVEKRIQGLINANIIEPVVEGMDTSFCSSMLVVPKGKEDIRLVIDLRGPNRYIHRTPFSMPTLERILAELDGATWFSTIDLSNAFFHIELDEDSRHLTNFFTEFGMFRCVRLPFGLCNAPDLFQEVLQRKILGGCKGCKNYLDDILVFGKTKEEHDENLAAVRSCLANHNVKLNEGKCVFGSQSVKFLGFNLTPDGWSIEDEKISAIRQFRTPSNCSEVKSFLGLITFVDKFIFHRATKTEHLRALATSESFYWTVTEDEEFNHLKKEALTTIKRLGYYSQSDRIELFVDASPTGLGAVLTQFNETGCPRIIACASKVLSPSEQRYPQTQKEALAVVWGVERFSYYLLTRSFVIRTDAEANQYIFNSNHRLGKRAITRAEGWALRLQPYDFSIQRIPGNENVADVLSRLIPDTQKTDPFEEDVEKHYIP